MIRVVYRHPRREGASRWVSAYARCESRPANVGTVTGNHCRCRFQGEKPCHNVLEEQS